MFIQDERDEGGFPFLEIVIADIDTADEGYSPTGRLAWAKARGKAIGCTAHLTKRDGTVEGQDRFD